MPEIDVLLASYNGEKYIAEQIDSILNQTFQDFRLLIRDDGSTDSTPAIIEEYARKYPGKIEVVHDNKGGGNFCRNFFALLEHARADYVMFCDQDDVWLPRKLEIMLESMKQTEHENPDKAVLVFCGKDIVDENLQSIDGLSGINIQSERYSLRQLLIVNCISGCTEMLNGELCRKLGGYSEAIDFHDWWVGLCAASVGVIRQVPEALVKYRQHSNNVVGTGQEIRFRKLKVVWSIIGHPFKKWQHSSRKFRLQGEKYVLLRERLLNDIPPDRLKVIDNWIAMFGSRRLARIPAFFRSGYSDVYMGFEKFMFLLKILFL